MGDTIYDRNSDEGCLEYASVRAMENLNGIDMLISTAKETISQCNIDSLFLQLLIANVERGKRKLDDAVVRLTATNAEKKFTLDCHEATTFGVSQDALDIAVHARSFELAKKLAVTRIVPNESHSE